MANKFEAGKKYISTESENPIYKCLFVSDQISVLKNLENNNEFSVRNVIDSYWKEYREPIKKTQYADVVLNPINKKISLINIRSKREDVFPWKHNELLDTIEINWEKYIPPMVHKAYVHWFRWNNGSIGSCILESKKDNPCGHPALYVQEVSFEEKRDA